MYNRNNFTTEPPNRIDDVISIPFNFSAQHEVGIYAYCIYLHRHCREPDNITCTLNVNLHGNNIFAGKYTLPVSKKKINHMIASQKQSRTIRKKKRMFSMNNKHDLVTSTKCVYACVRSSDNVKD